MSTDSSPEQELAAFGQAVRELREQRGMSLDALSRAGRLPRGRKMSARRISRIEAGEVDPHHDEMIALADALGVTVGRLVGDAEALAG
ncbi:MAG TPA: helix-turn-helix transcriptional regulator [Solirubrobacteraceae bacterium]|jgi:transcriptional regulator with XRE-family HTH domain|nr:helix-turn-helix transcriptional regulator [Solirubrobacteraceae bacterium]